MEKLFLNYKPSERRQKNNLLRSSTHHSRWKQNVCFKGCVLLINVHIWVPDQRLWDRHLVDPTKVGRIPGQEFICPVLMKRRMTSMKTNKTLIQEIFAGKSYGFYPDVAGDRLRLLILQTSTSLKLIHCRASIY